MKITLTDEQLEAVGSALNIGCSLALVHQREMHPRMLAANIAFDDAVREASYDDDSNSPPPPAGPPR